MDAQPVSLHQRILADISERIVSGDWPPGHRIPFEHELSAEYQCSRMTVNKALSQLAKSGLIERRRRSGSFVTRPRSQAAILEIHDIKQEVQALGRPYRYELAARIVRRATAADRQRFDVAAASSVVELSCRHFAGKSRSAWRSGSSISPRSRKRPTRASPTSRQGHGSSAASHGVRPSTRSVRPRRRSKRRLPSTSPRAALAWWSNGAPGAPTSR